MSTGRAFGIRGSVQRAPVGVGGDGGRRGLHPSDKGVQKVFWAGVRHGQYSAGLQKMRTKDKDVSSPIPPMGA